MLERIMDNLKEHFTVTRVFGEPIERDGAIVLPVASVAGGGGGGQDADDNSGGGFGGQARPVGAYVIRNGQVRWHPAWDVNRLAVASALVLTVHLLTRRRRGHA